MDKFLVGAGVALVGAIVGWGLSFFTDRWRERKEGETAARLVFFELGVFFTAAARLANDEPVHDSEVDASTWERYGAALSRIASTDLLSALAVIYTNEVRWLSSQVDRQRQGKSIIASSGLGDTQRKVWKAAWDVGRLAQFSEVELSAYFESVKRSWIPGQAPEGLAGSSEDENRGEDGDDEAESDRYEDEVEDGYEEDDDWGEEEEVDAERDDPRS
jgi:hypothetical protein